MPAEGSVPTLADILFSAHLLLALSAYAVLTGMEAVVAARMHAALEEGAGAWLWEHLYAPMLRAGILMAFLLLAYPAIYGIGEAPSATGILFGEQGRFGHLLGVVFLLSLMLPLLPVVGRLPGLVLPIQGIAGAALLFHWLAQSSGHADISYWPGAGTVLLIGGVSVAAYWLATRAVSAMQDLATHWNVADLDELVFDAVLLLLQAPAIIIYSVSLGRQLVD